MALEPGISRSDEFVVEDRQLPDGKATVGFEVCIKHVAGAVEGARCIVSAVLREVVDGRKLRFDVEVREGERVIGVGTHERRARSSTATACVCSSAFDSEPAGSSTTNAVPCSMWWFSQPVAIPW